MSKVSIAITILFVCLICTGCSIIGFGGAMAQAHEDQKIIEKEAEYLLDDMKIAVVISTDLSIHYEHPNVSNTIAEAVAARIAKHVPSARVLNPTYVARWQFETPQWSAMASSEITKQLNVDRVIYIDLQEFRLTPPGNQFLWEGMSSAIIGIIEANSYEQDGFTETYYIDATFPNKPSVLSREEASENKIMTGLLSEFIKKTSWLFYLHKEPKYPDRYRPELET
ncbi:MAG: hypothetical protein QF718_01575 [Phycisphaerales bacterium]|jgi:hypothetical protein|nr:hypothetical protein [Phycisphaerales bacterium]